MGKRLLSALLVFLMLGVQAFAQNSVTGKVTDSKGEAIPGASIMVKGTNTGVITDLDGNFRIKVGANAELVFSSIGYKTTTVPVGNRGVINVILEDDTLLLGRHPRWISLCLQCTTMLLAAAQKAARPKTESDRNTHFALSTRQ